MDPDVCQLDSLPAVTQRSAMPKVNAPHLPGDHVCQSNDTTIVSKNIVYTVKTKQLFQAGLQLYLELNLNGAGIMYLLLFLFYLRLT